MRRIAFIIASLAPVLYGCGASNDPAEGESSEVDEHMPISGICDDVGNDDAFADCIEDLTAAAEVTFGHDRLPGVVLGAPEGGGEANAGNDTVALGCGGMATLYFEPPHIVDGPGPDLIVFENPFVTGETTFSEPAQVLVSVDGERWQAFDCAPDGDGAWPPTGCAGIEPVYATADNGLATDPGLAGGDAFDLADVGLAEARYVRVVDRTFEHYGSAMWCGGAAGGFDLDAMVAIPHGGSR